MRLMVTHVAYLCQLFAPGECLLVAACVAYNVHQRDTLPDAMTNPAILPPSLIEALAGTYELLQEIGRGGMGIVYAGRDVRLDRLVAIKVLPDMGSSDAVRERFLREARPAARVPHPSTVPS